MQVKDFAEKKEQKKEYDLYEFSGQNKNRAIKALSRQDHFDSSFSIFPNLMLLGIVSQFDAYMGKILRICLELKPHIVLKSNKSFPAHEVFQYTDVNSFREAVVDKEVESFLRKSHEEQFDWIGEILETKTRENLDSWPVFIEACERRNLFAHSSGIVSEQYIIKCRSAGFETNSQKGTQLKVDAQYLSEILCVFLELGIKISQLMARKIDGSEKNLIQQDNVLNHIGYELVFHGHYRAAASILEFGTSVVKKHFDPILENMMIVNLANAYKMQGQNERCDEILSSRDWRAFDAKFRISVASIRQDLPEVLNLMPQLVNDEEFTKESYKDWPVFSHVRDQKRFKEKYEKLYKESFEQKISIEDNGSL